MKVLFFAPHARFWQHSFPEALVAEAIAQGGHTVRYFTCDRVFQSRCIPMIAQGMGINAPEVEKRKVCDACESRKQLLVASFNFQAENISAFIDRSDTQKVDEIVDRPDPETLIGLTCDGLPVGQYALYQLVLGRKLLTTKFGSEEERAEYKIELKNTLLALFASKKILDLHKPDRVVVYNGLYSVNRTFCKLAEMRGAKSYFLHAGPSLANQFQRLMIGQKDTFTYMPHSVKVFDRFAHIPCTARLLSTVTDHYRELFRARSPLVYSSAKGRRPFDVRNYFGIQPHQKVLLAALSSPDEDIAAKMIGARQYGKDPLFPSQIDWVKALIKFVAKRGDLFLLIRVHPREFPNRRESAKSQHALQLQEALHSPPQNAAVNWPDDQISLYDLAEHADVVLNAWSSAGKEMSALGLPVVIYSNEIPLYPATLNYLGEQEDDYFRCIEQALKDGWNFEHIRAAYRWGAFELDRTTVSIASGYPAASSSGRSIGRRLVDRLMRKVDPLVAERRDCRRRGSPLDTSGEIVRVIESGALSPADFLDPETTEQSTLEQETRNLKLEVTKLANALYPNSASRRSSRLYARMTNS
jgi:hypothetical protein